MVQITELSSDNYSVLFGDVFQIMVTAFDRTQLKIQPSFRFGLIALKPFLTSKAGLFRSLAGFRA